MYLHDPLKGMPKAAARAAVARAIAEVEVLYLDAIEHHGDEVAEIFSDAVKKRSEQIPEERRAAGRALMERLRKGAAEEQQRQKSETAKAPNS